PATRAASSAPRWTAYVRPRRSSPVSPRWSDPERGRRMGVLLDREEYIEQVYFFRHTRERLADNLATQDVLDRIHEEILSTTRLPMAIQFLATELRHAGLLSSGFAR